MKYFIVKTKCGHVGRTNCIWINFAVAASSAKAASEKARGYKRVKRNHKDFIAAVTEVGFEEYIVQKTINEMDPYLHCKSRKEQNSIEYMEYRIEPDEFNLRKLEKKTNERESVEYRMKKSRALRDDGMRQIREFAEYAG